MQPNPSLTLSLNISSPTFVDIELSYLASLFDSLEVDVEQKLDISVREGVSSLNTMHGRIGKEVIEAIDRCRTMSSGSTCSDLLQAILAFNALYTQSIVLHLNKISSKLVHLIDKKPFFLIYYYTYTCCTLCNSYW
jgi:hypothetical protein